VLALVVMSTGHKHRYVVGHDGIRCEVAKVVITSSRPTNGELATTDTEHLQTRRCANLFCLALVGVPADVVKLMPSLACINSLALQLATPSASGCLIYPSNPAFSPCRRHALSQPPYARRQDDPAGSMVYFPTATAQQ
jgi:hypothetical protein